MSTSQAKKNFKDGNLPDDIVISGISGRYPESENIDEFKDNLLKGTDLVTDDERRWPRGMYGLPARMGKLKNLSHFDASFFGVNAKSAHTMDPQSRILLEATFEALVDAGVNPAQVRGTNTGVFISVGESESRSFWITDVEKIDGYGLIGTNRTMFPNKISYAFDLKGPSYAIESACSGSTIALQRGVHAIKTGECDAAIVGGCQICLQPESCLEAYRLFFVGLDGISKAFDKSGNGYVRSEAVGVAYLQKASEAHRIYATVVGINSNNDGYKTEGIQFPSGKMHKRLFESVYNDTGVNPNDVQYLEAHAAGTNEGDPQEVNSVADVFCKNRKKPLIVGSVKSNMGHSELASGFCALSKVIIAMETGIIPANLHFTTPHPDIPGLVDGRLRVLTKNEPWEGGYAAINAFGFGGSNAHVLLHSHSKQKPKWESDRIPRLVTISGRTENAVAHLLTKINEHKEDKELLALINKVFSSNITGHNYRGYSIFNSTDLTEEIVQVSANPRPIWFVYSGVGSQWNLMAKQLMPLDVFRKSIKLSADTLSRHGLDLESILENTSENAFENILETFVAIVAIQIALTDVLTSIGIKPDGVIGHSVGETGCGYADTALTAEEAILITYNRGRAILESNSEPGAMAVVGLTWEECKKRCPPEIIPACHNSNDNVTVSGPPKAIEEFITKLKSENIFARAVNSSNCAFHSKYIQDAEPILMSYLNKLIPNPKRRSAKWISSSIPESQWNSNTAQFSSAAYFVNNLVSPVLFNEAIQHVPDNAITIEIAPHGLLQAILKRALNTNVTNISLMKKNHSDNIQFLLSNIGRIYNAGGQPKIEHLYEPISFPVSRGTPSIGPLIKWDHSTEWTVADFSGRSNTTSGKHVVSINLNDEDYQYLTGHVIDGQLIFPRTGLLYLAWKMLAKIKNQLFEKMPVVIEDFQVLKSTPLPKEGSVKFVINILEGSGKFEISESGETVATGTILAPKNIDKEFSKDITPAEFVDNNMLPLRTSDVYQELHLHGYEYGGIFRGIVECDNHGRVGKLNWNKNWVSFLDTMLQFTNIELDSCDRELYLPAKLKKVVINPVRHSNLVAKDNPISIYICNKTGVLKSGGVEITGVKKILVSDRLKQVTPILESYTFSPLLNVVALKDATKSKTQALTLSSHLVFENCSGTTEIQIVEVPGSTLLAPIIKKVLETRPGVIFDYTVINYTGNDVAKLENLGISTTTGTFRSNADLIVLSDTNCLENANSRLTPGGFILLEQDNAEARDADILKMGLEIVSTQVAAAGCKKYLVLRKPINPSVTSPVIKITHDSFNWVEPLKDALKKSSADGTKIYLVAQKQLSGLVGLVNGLKQEPGGNNVRSYYLQSTNAETFSLSSPFYTNQIKKDLVHNILNCDSEWGTFRNLPLDAATPTLLVEHAYVCSLNKGDFSGFKWLERPSAYLKSAKNQELCTVYYSALNLQDCLLATGKVPANQENVMGLGFSGRDANGRRIMGIANDGSLATTCFARSEFLWEVPDTWSLKEAATVPVAYAIGYYAMVVRAKVRPGNIVLVIDPSSSIGQASIHIASSAGCVVLATASNECEKDFLNQNFPELKGKIIENLVDCSLISSIKDQTNQQGVDVIVHDSHSSRLPVLLSCLAFGGCMLDIGIFSHTADVLSESLDNHNIMEVFLNCSSSEKAQVTQLVNKGIASSVVKPLPALVFNIDDMEKAFKTSLANAKTVLLKICDENENAQKVSVTPRILMHSDKNYIILGGLGEIELELANWLITKGATKLTLVTRTGIKTGYQAMCIRRWNDKGVNVKILKNNVTTLESAKSLLVQCNIVGAVGGIFNLAAFLQDSLMENQTGNNFKTVAASKIDVAKHFDSASQKLAPHLDYFVIFSSVSCSYGNIGQADYMFANFAMERICELRRRKGFPGLAIQWGGIGDVNKTVVGGTFPQRIASCLSTLDVLLQQEHPIVCSFVLAEKHKKRNEDAGCSITDIVVKILELKNTRNIPETSTLADLGMDSFMGMEVKQILKDDYDLTLSSQAIRNLPFSGLINMTKKVSGTSVKCD